LNHLAESTEKVSNSPGGEGRQLPKDLGKEDVVRRVKKQGIKNLRE